MCAYTDECEVEDQHSHITPKNPLVKVKDREFAEQAAAVVGAEVFGPRVSPLLKSIITESIQILLRERNWQVTEKPYSGRIASKGHGRRKAERAEALYEDNIEKIAAPHVMVQCDCGGSMFSHDIDCALRVAEAEAAGYKLVKVG